MSKNIKAIKCPQCGSTKVQELRTDYYRCTSCKTEFFLDNDDININIRNQPAAQPPFPKKILLTGAVVAVAFFVILPLLIRGCFASAPVSAAFDKPEEKERWWLTNETFFQADDGTPVFLKFGSRQIGAKEGIVAAMYDGRTGKKISEEDLPVKEMDMLGEPVRNFDDGTSYFIINKKLLYRINKKSKTIENVTAANFSEQPALQSGFARIEFINDYYGKSGFNIMTNSGQQAFFFPISNQIFMSEDELRNASPKPPKSAPLRQDTVFEFSYRYSSDKDIKLRLFRYVRRFAPGYLGRTPWIHFQEDTNLNAPPDFNKLIKEYPTLREGGVLSITDVTPGRLYFDPEVLDYNSKYVLISFRTSPANDAPISIQLMDAATMKILWTLDTSTTNDSGGSLAIGKGLLTKEGIFADFNLQTLFIDYKGKVIQKFEN